MHRSNPRKAFDACDMKHDHTMFSGKLYECPAMSSLPEFMTQFDLRLDQRQMNMLLGYQPLTADCSDEQLLDFVATKNNHIPQCEFCPEHIKWHTALGELKENLPKPKFDEAVKEEDLERVRYPTHWLTPSSK